ncbi:UNVERIFIED_CONTAM: putative protein phosphatase 2C 47 [Sesamum radiatum]|uniref:Uncharacterized protein n=1 Tax=Sesamum radiatum TaxID=300843 RepID=A0AAW2P3V5_SESRA
MAPGADAKPCQGKLGNGLGKENGKKSEEDCNDLGQAKVARPPLMRHCISHATLADPYALEWATENGVKSLGKDSGFIPMFRSGSCSEMGPKPYMEDEYICVDNLSDHLATPNAFPSAGAFYGWFNLLSEGLKTALKNAFVRADHALADAKNLDHSSGTTALTALILGR